MKYEKAAMYRRVFGTQEGKLVLADLLNDLGIAKISEDQEDVIKRNAALWILNKMGVFTAETYLMSIEALMSIPIPTEQKENRNVSAEQ